MIKAKIGNGECRVKIAGDLETITREAQEFLVSVYNGLLEENEDAAETFERLMLESIKQGIVFVAHSERKQKIREATDRKMAELHELMTRRVGRDGADLLESMLNELRENAEGN